MTYLLEIVDSLGNGTTVQAHFNTSCGLAINVNIEKDGIGNLGIRVAAEEALEHATNHWQLCRRSDFTDGSSMTVGDNGCKRRSQGKGRGQDKERVEEFHGHG